MDNKKNEIGYSRFLLLVKEICCTKVIMTINLTYEDGFIREDVVRKEKSFITKYCSELKDGEYLAEIHRLPYCPQKRTYVENSMIKFTVHSGVVSFD